LKHSLAVILLLLLSSSATFCNETVGPASQAKLTVQVTNATANGGSVVGDTVTVAIYQHEKLLTTTEAVVASNSEAVFEGIPTGEHMVAVVGAKHQGMMFSGHHVTLRPPEKVFSADVQVFDVSYDKSKLSVQAHHFIIKTRAAALEITEYMRLKNSSDMAVTSKDRDSQDRAIVVAIRLPEQFKDLRISSYFEQEALVFAEWGFYDTIAVPPGEHDVGFSYTLDIDSDTMDIVKEVSLPTSSFVLFAELGQAEIKGLGQAASEVRAANGAPMRYYKLESLAPQEKVAFQIAGFNVSKSNLSTWLILAVVTGAITLLAILRLLSQKVDRENG
jgi:hypothetical protein